MALPLGEAHAALDGVTLESLPRLGETVSVTEHMQRNFFDVLGSAERELYEFTVPVLVARRHLERLKGWRDWRTLAVYLGQEGLEPVMVFRNTPLPVKVAAFETSDHYTADVRVLCGQEASFAWDA